MARARADVMVMPVSNEEHAEGPQPVSGTRPRAQPAQPVRLSPDDEAMLLMMKMVERVEVAKSFAKIAAGLLTVTAARAVGHVPAIDRARKIAHAAAAAAVHVATHRAEPPAPPAEESQDQ